MKSHNFILGPCDTDSISFCKPDQSPMTKEEQEQLINEINSLMPEYIKYAHDGYFKRVIVLRTKNYILYDGKKIKYKGSAVKATTKEPALREFIQRIIQAILDDTKNYTEIYNEYVKEILCISDIKRWSSRKTITEKTLTSERTNETKIKDALEESDYVEGDRIYTYFKEDGTLGLVENFDGNYDKKKLLEKLFKTTKTFENVLPVKELFLNYALKRNEGLLNEF